MKKRYSSIIIIIVALVSLTAISCRDKTQTNIVGTWKLIPHTKPDTTTIYWDFYSGNELEISTVQPSSTVVRKYTYNASGRDLSIFGNDIFFDTHGYTPGPLEFRGEYHIYHLGEDNLKMEKVGHGADGDFGNPYLRIEMVKQ